jgi:hypothetical protein
MAKMFIGENFRSPLARISYAQSLYKPNTDGKHMPSLIVPNTNLAALKEAVATVVVGEWGDKGKERFKNGLIKNPIIPGDGKSARNKQTGELYPGMGPDVSFIRPWSKNPIKCFGPDVLPMDPSDVKSGWWGYAVLTAFAWHNAEQGDGVGFWISMWQHIKEDETFGGSDSANPDAFFEKVKVEASASKAAGGASDMFD